MFIPFGGFVGFIVVLLVCREIDKIIKDLTKR